MAARIEPRLCYVRRADGEPEEEEEEEESVGSRVQPRLCFYGKADGGPQEEGRPKTQGSTKKHHQDDYSICIPSPGGIEDEAYPD